MSQSFAAIIAAFVAAGAALLTAFTAANSLRKQEGNRAIVEHGHWRRQTRFEAYQGFYSALSEALGVLEKNRIKTSGQPKAATSNSLDDSYQALLRSSDKVLLAGPELMSTISIRICGQYRVMRDMLQARPAVRVEDEKWQAEASELLSLTALFPLAARKVLDAATPMRVPYPNEEFPGESRDGLHVQSQHRRRVAA